MKYSLRSLMIVVTLVCVVLGLLGARIEYLRRRAAFHEREAKRYRDEEHRKYALYAAANNRPLVSGMAVPALEEARANYYHEEMARAFRQAVYRPWMPIAEPPECTELRKWHTEDPPP